MADPLFVRVTHTGFFPDGRPNLGPIQITDLDTGMENQNRKVPVYIPVNGSVDIPLSSRSMLSLQQGALAKFASAGLIDLQLGGNPVGGISHKVLWAVADGDTSSWEEAYKVVNSSKAPVKIVVRSDDLATLKVPSGTYDLHDSGFESYRLGNYGANIVDIQDGALLRNIGPTTWSVALTSSSSSPCIENDPLPGGPPIYFLDFGAIWQNNGTAPMIQVPDNQLIVFAMRGGGTIPGTQPVIAMGDASICILTFREGTQNFDGGIISGPATSILILSHDGSIPFPFPAFPSFLGTIINSPIGTLGGAGPTAMRPSNGIAPVSVGCMYFDTDLAPTKPIWWDGVQWVDATGAVVLW